MSENNWGHALAQLVVQHVRQEVMGDWAVLSEPRFTVGERVGYEGSIEEFVGRTGTILEVVPQPEGKAFRYRYVVTFGEFKTISHVRPTSLHHLTVVG